MIPQPKDKAPMHIEYQTPETRTGGYLRIIFSFCFGGIVGAFVFSSLISMIVGKRSIFGGILITVPILLLMSPIIFVMATNGIFTGPVGKRRSFIVGVLVSAFFLSGYLLYADWALSG